MRFFVGTVEAAQNESPCVYVASDNTVVNLTTLDNSIGHDLRNLVEIEDVGIGANPIVAGEDVLGGGDV